VNNDTFKRIQVRAQAAVQNTSTSTSNANDILPKVKDWCRTRYDRILRAFPWGELLRSYNLSVTANTRDYALRYNLESIIKMYDSTNNKEITEVDIRDQIRFDEHEASSSGTPDKYIDIGIKACSALLSTADQIQVLSTSVSDITPMVVRITGEVSGMPISESIVLQGTTPVSSSNTYDSGAELTITVGTSSGVLQDLAGVVTVREKTTTSNVIAKLAPNERAPYFKWIRFDRIPSAALTAQIWYKRKWAPLVNDLDAPIIPCANEIIEGIIADALWEDGQEAAASAQEGKFGNSVKELWIARRSRNLITQIVPDQGEPQYNSVRNLYDLGESY